VGKLLDLLNFLELDVGLEHICVKFEAFSLVIEFLSFLYSEKSLRLA
jgi:hypothetical protein